MAIGEWYIQPADPSKTTIQIIISNQKCTWMFKIKRQKTQKLQLLNRNRIVYHGSFTKLYVKSTEG